MADMPYREWARQVRTLNANPSGSMPVNATALRQALGGGPAEVGAGLDDAMNLMRQRASMVNAPQLNAQVASRIPPGFYEPSPPRVPASEMIRQTPVRLPQMPRTVQPGETTADVLDRLLGPNPEAQVPRGVAQQKLDQALYRGTLRDLGNLRTPNVVPQTQIPLGQTPASFGPRVVQPAQAMARELGGFGPRLAQPVDAMSAMKSYGRVVPSAEKAANFGSFFQKAAAAAPAAEALAEAAPAAAKSGGVLSRVGQLAAPGAGALGVAARWLPTASLGVGVANAAYDAFNPQSDLRQAGIPAKNDFYRDVREGNYGRAAGDAARSVLATYGQLAKQVLMPPVLGGAAQGLVGGERPSERAERQRAEAVQSLMDEARMQQGGAPVAAAPAKAKAHRLVPLDVMSEYAKIYRQMAPKTTSINDQLKAKIANDIIQQSQQMQNADEKTRKAHNQMINQLTRLTGGQQWGWGPLYGDDGEP